MSAILPYARLSAYQHTTASNLILQKGEILQTFFPLASYDGDNASKVSAFFITTSSGGKTLILADALAFVNLRNSCDPMRELLPVIFDCCPRNCSMDLTAAVRDHGYTVGGSTRLIALQIESDTRNGLSKFFFPSYQEEDPHVVLARVIRGEIQEG